MVEKQNAVGYDYFCGVVDEEDEGVYCEHCHYDMHWNAFGDAVVCDECGWEMSREEFFNYIGAEAKPRCYSCDEHYPQCKETCGEFIN